MLITISSYYAFKFQKLAIKNHDWIENKSKGVTSSHNNMKACNHWIFS